MKLGCIQRNGQGLAVYRQHMCPQIIRCHVHVSRNAANVQRLPQAHRLGTIPADVRIILLQRESLRQHVIIQNILRGTIAPAGAPAVVRVGSTGNEFLLGQCKELAGAEPESTFDGLGSRKSPATVAEGGKEEERQRKMSRNYKKYFSKRGKHTAYMKHHDTSPHSSFPAKTALTSHTPPGFWAWSPRLSRASPHGWGGWSRDAPVGATPTTRTHSPLPLSA